MSTQFSGQDEIIICCDCKESFSFTVKDQEFYTRMNFTDKPKRCRNCRSVRKASREAKESVQAQPQAQEDYNRAWRGEEDGNRKGRRQRSR